MGVFINGVVLRDAKIAAKITTTASIDLTSTGSTTLYTVPTGKTFIPLEIILRVTSASAANGDAEAQVENTASSGDIVATTILSGMTSVDDSYRLSPGIGGTIRICDSAETVKLNVTSAESGTTLDVSADLFGYLL